MKKSLDYAKMGAEAIMRKFTPEELPPSARFHYHQGVFLAGVERIYRLTGEERYADYIKKWVDVHIDDDGNAPTCHLTEFDDIQPGILLFRIYRETGDVRYKKLLDSMYRAIEMWPTNAKGGVWHKHHNPNQMWLDTMYMLGVFATMYALEFDKPYLHEKIHTQMMLMHTYMTNPGTGLMYHAWDDSKAVPIADRETGLIKRSWGRAMGWYAVALAEIIELLPEEHYLREDYIKVERKLLVALAKYQDKQSGLWYQLVDKGDDVRNWTETSCSALFTYAMAKAMRLGIVGDEYRAAVENGYRGVISKTEIKDDVLIMKDICIGTGIGPEQFYFDRPTVENDLHGMGSFLLMTTELSRLGM